MAADQARLMLGGVADVRALAGFVCQQIGGCLMLGESARIAPRMPQNREDAQSVDGSG